MTETTRRIGLLVPSSNTTVEVELFRALPRDITLHVARCYLTRIEPASISRLLEDVDREAGYLASADVDVVVLGATAPSFLKGKGFDKELTARISKATGGKMATTASSALLAALDHLGIRRPALTTAFKPNVNEIAVKFLSDNGYDVVASDGLGMVENLEVGRLAPETARAAARDIDVPEADAIILACTNWQSMAVLAELEWELGKPVLSTSQVCLWHALTLIDHKTPIEGYGRLLSQGLAGQGPSQRMPA